MKNKKIILCLYAGIGATFLGNIIINSIKFSKADNLEDKILCFNNILGSALMLPLFWHFAKETAKENKTVNNLNINFAENSRVSGLFSVEMKGNPQSSSDLHKMTDSPSPI